MTVQIICEVVINQNKQLLKIIAEEEGLPYDEMVRLILPTHQRIVQLITPRKRHEGGEQKDKKPKDKKPIND